MNNAPALLKKVDLLAFITQSENSGATMRISSTSGGNFTGVISFPTCGNWINKPGETETIPQTAPALFRAMGIR